MLQRSLFLSLILSFTLLLFSFDTSCPFGECDEPDENEEFCLIEDELKNLFNDINFTKLFVDNRYIEIGGYSFANWEVKSPFVDISRREEEASVLGIRAYYPKYLLSWRTTQSEVSDLGRSLITIFPDGKTSTESTSSLDEDGEEDFEELHPFSCNSYHNAAALFSQLRQDLNLLFEEETKYYALKISDVKNDLALILKNKHSTPQEPKYLYINCEQITNNYYAFVIKPSELMITRLKKNHVKHLNAVYKVEKEVNKILREIHEFCLVEHENDNARYELALLNFYEGKLLDAFFHIKELINLADSEENLKKFVSDVQLLNGKLCNELSLYQEAIHSLCRSIQANPENKEAYFERAVAYFETGKFDSSLEDYLHSELKPQMQQLFIKETLDFSTGISLGIVKGGIEGLINYVPSMLSSAEGLAHALWAFAKDPVQVSKDFMESAQACMDFIREHALVDVGLELVPELKTLVQEWDTLGQVSQGEALGYVIGKYGVDIFAGAGIAKCMNTYRNLKKANNLLTFEAAAISQRNKAIIALEAQKRAEARKLILSSKYKIQWDKQGKHIEGHRNFPPERKNSVFTHSDAQKLFDQFGGTGMKHRGIPGSAGHQEIVNFKELIGFSVNQVTGEKIATTWGKIHYAEEGVHIVPIKPRQ